MNFTIKLLMLEGLFAAKAQEMGYHKARYEPQLTHLQNTV